MKVIEQMSPNQKPRKQKVEFIILHATAGSAKGALAWLTNPKSKVSCHYLIDKEGQIYMLVPENCVAWHCGKSKWGDKTNLNECSIGIELENLNTGIDPYPEAQLLSLNILCRKLLQHFNLTKDAILTHYQIAPHRKTDPRGFPLEAFLETLTKEEVCQKSLPISQPTGGKSWKQSWPFSALRHLWQN